MPAMAAPRDDSQNRGLAALASRLPQQTTCPPIHRQCRYTRVFFLKGNGTWQTNGTAALVCITPNHRKTSAR
ncbi:hypothetical protein WG29040_12195 [Pseudomonas sp. PAMC 29040]|nr:hypothetical protein [Pseudomonas sp. TMW22089]NBG93405.1 hypothetical protein [Pseudomonas sp. 9.1(2019)]RUT37278.1 hypothetical protein WG29040_12195 [Pseudomonas sp. PAMC 29040]